MLLVDILILPPQVAGLSLAAACQEAHLLSWAAVSPFQEVCSTSASTPWLPTLYRLFLQPRTCKDMPAHARTYKTTQGHARIGKRVGFGGFGVTCAGVHLQLRQVHPSMGF